MRKKIFVETTIHIERLFSDATRQAQIERNLVSLLRRLSAGTAIHFSVRTFQRVMLIYGYLLDHFSTFIVPAAILIDYLEYNRDITIPARFFESIDEYFDFGK